MNTSFAISQTDLATVRGLLDHEDAFSPLDTREREGLQHRLAGAEILDDDTAASMDLAGLNDLVRVEMGSGRDRDQFEFSLVLPHEANFEDDQISILSPLGAAVFGQKAGTNVTMETPDGPRPLQLLAVFRKASIH